MSFDRILNPVNVGCAPARAACQKGCIEKMSACYLCSSTMVNDLPRASAGTVSAADDGTINMAFAAPSRGSSTRLSNWVQLEPVSRDPWRLRLTRLPAEPVASAVPCWWWPLGTDVYNVLPLGMIGCYNIYFVSKPT